MPRIILSSLAIVLSVGIVGAQDSDKELFPELDDLDRALRKIVDPEMVDARAKADQAARIAAAGSRRAILEKGSFGYTPAPGEAVVYR